MADYLSQQYRIIITPEYGSWTATIPDLPGCMAVGDSPEEALELIQDAKQSWISASIMHNLPMPEPSHS